MAVYATGWMNDSLGQQRLHATEQRVPSAGEQPSVVTRVAAAQEGPDEAMRQALAASDADVVKKDQMGGEKPVLLFGSPIRCIIAIKSQKVVERRVKHPGRDANRASDVKYKNFVEQCARHPEEKEMYQVPGKTENRSCMRICGTGGLVDSVSSRR